jgi:predicted nucleotidyltransferase
MNTTPRTFRVDMSELEFAFESGDQVFAHYLDLQTGQVLMVPGYAYSGDDDDDMDRAVELIESDPERFLLLESEADLRPSIEDAREFARGVEDQSFGQRLEAALNQRRGAFRRFLDILHEESGEVERWHHESRQQLRAKIAAWLAARGVNILYEPLPPWQPRNDVRSHLLTGAAAFVQRVKQIRGVTRIALVGSLTTPKRAPNDVDLLVTINTDAVVPQIAAAGRKLQGFVQQLNRGADIFLANPSHQYLGRTCPWRECGPGIRTRCEAQHCGGHLYDDLHVLTLPSAVIATPPVVLWPQASGSGEVPADVREAFGL